MRSRKTWTRQMVAIDKVARNASYKAAHAAKVAGATEDEMAEVRDATWWKVWREEWRKVPV